MGRGNEQGELSLQSGLGGLGLPVTECLTFTGGGEVQGVTECNEGDILSSIIWFFHCWFILQPENRMGLFFGPLYALCEIQITILQYTYLLICCEWFSLSLNIISSITPSLIAIQHFYCMMLYTLLSQSSIIRELKF